MKRFLLAATVFAVAIACGGSGEVADLESPTLGSGGPAAVSTTTPAPAGTTPGTPNGTGTGTHGVQTANGVLIFSGTPKEMGEQQADAFTQSAGTLLKEWLLPKLSIYGFLSQWWASHTASTMEKNVLPVHLEEVRAFAAKSKLDYANLLVANGSADIMQLITERNLFGCSTFVVTPGRSASSRMIVGRNLDYPDSTMLRAQWKPVVYARTGTLKMLSLHVPGLSGVLTGINERGVFLAIKVSHQANSTSNGTPAGFIFREILEQATTGAEAVELYKKAWRTVPLNVTITDPKEAYEFENDATAFAVRRPSDATGLLYGANHYESTTMPNGGPAGRDFRWPILSSRDADTRKIDLEGVRTVIAGAGGFFAGQEGESTNVFASFVEYGATIADTVVTWGSDPKGNGVSAKGELQHIRLGDVF